MKPQSGRFVFRKTPALIEQVDVVMREYGYASLSEMFRCLVRDAYRSITKERKLAAWKERAEEAKNLSPHV